jgi:hypothetical protein
MTVEGDKIVVAWTSGESNKAWQSYDIYYATSKNGGKLVNVAQSSTLCWAVADDMGLTLLII